MTRMEVLCSCAKVSKRNPVAPVPLKHTVNMESEEVLNVLLEIEDRPGLSQRELAALLGVSLGKTNYILKALIQKGLIKAGKFKQSENKTGYIYLLTPQGIEEKARITYRFLKRKKREYERLEKEIQRLTGKSDTTGSAGSQNK